MSKAVAVIDFGITNLKVLLIDRNQQIIARCDSENIVSPGPPYQHMDVAAIWHWLLDALRRLAAAADIEAIIPCTHGSAAALIDDDDLVLPLMHYEAQPPAGVVAAYAALMPAFNEVYAPLSPAGLTLARQLLWQQMRYPQAFGRTRFILCYPQYWAWRLSGVAASEVTSLGAQTHLWAPRRDDFSTLSGQQGWRRLFPPRRNAWDTLATLRSDISRHTGIAAATPVLCGIHDSNANYLRYLAAGWDDFSLMSTGTWIINFNRSFDLGGLIAGYDTNTNSDVYGRPVACSRFMGGREYALIAQDVTIPAQAADIERIIRAGVMALPSFSDSGGPFPGTGAQGRVIGPPPGDSAARPTLAVLYSALMAAAALNHIGTENDIIIDGSFAKNVMFCRLLAALFGRRRIWRSSERDGTACGAALLWRLEQRTEPVGLDLQRVEPLTLSGLGNYAARWRELVAADPAARENESRSRKNDD